VASLSKGEVRTALVDSFTFKGFSWAIPVYRIEHTHRTRTIEGQYIVMTDLQGFSTLVANASIFEVEKMLDGLHDLVAGGCREFGGTTRYSHGDAYCVTFPETALALAAVDRLARQWRVAGWPCALGLAMHKGALHAFRDFLYSRDLWVAGSLERTIPCIARGDSIVYLTGHVRRDLAGTEWDARVERVEVANDQPVARGRRDLSPRRGLSLGRSARTHATLAFSDRPVRHRSAPRRTPSTRSGPRDARGARA
jgi:hypothetical protein